MKSPLEEQEIKAILSTASTAAKKAGEIIMANSSGADVTKTKANTRDLLTMIDPLCEKIIRDTVLTNFPTHDFLGEVAFIGEILAVFSSSAPSLICFIESIIS